MAREGEELEAFGAGKVILLGEHAVVYGHPALAGPLQRGVRARGRPARAPSVTPPKGLTRDQAQVLTRAFRRSSALVGAPPLTLSFESELPVSMGLGSSGALSVAAAGVLLRAAGKKPTRARIEALALEMEREFHGTPSGLDHTTSARGQLLLFRRKQGSTRGKVAAVESKRPLKILVALTGVRGPTKHTVGSLRDRVARWPRRYKRLFGEIGALVDEGAKAITRGDLEGLGDIMDANQGLLSALQVSSAPIEEMVFRLRALGALGAKLTGAGGGGGAVIGLFAEPEPAVARLTQEGVRCFGSQIAGPLAL